MPVIRLLVLAAIGLPLFGQSTCSSYHLSSSGVLAASTATDPNNLPSFYVTTSGSCPYVVATGASWIHITPPSGGSYFSGSGAVTFSLDQNSGTQFRSDEIVVYPGMQITPGEQILTYVVKQLAGTCTYSLSPASASVGVGGGTGTVTVTSGCQWTATPSSFIKLTPTGTIVGNQALSYTVAANGCVSARSGQVALNVVAGATAPAPFTISQDGSASNLTISTTSVNATSAALPAQPVAVTTGAGCSWNSFTDALTWIHLTGNVSGSGPGTLNYALDANLGGPRTGHIIFQSGKDPATGFPIQAAILTVTQAATQVPVPQISAVVNGASYSAGGSTAPPISPGEIVAIFGSNLGPASPVSNTQSYGTQLAGVQVLFGATAAPLIFVSTGQINAVVPYAVSGSSSIAVAVQAAGQVSTAVTVPVQATTPGIFSHDGSGSGPGAILNQDYKLNSDATPATAGSVVQIYCTGTGITAPASADGALAPMAPPFPMVAAQPVTVTIGGISAQVVYAGAAPGLIAGLTQIDAVVPAGIATSTAQVVVTAGGVASQGNLSIAVK